MTTVVGGAVIAVLMCEIFKDMCVCVYMCVCISVCTRVCVYTCV